MVDQKVIELIWRALKKHGKIIFDRLKSWPYSIHWTWNGELIIRGKQLPESNSSDMISYVVNVRQVSLRMESYFREKDKYYK